MPLFILDRLPPGKGAILVKDNKDIGSVTFEEDEKKVTMSLMYDDVAFENCYEERESECTDAKELP